MPPCEILFISPIMPLKQGLGLAMRAWLFLQALAAQYRVLLLILPVGPQVNPVEGLQAVEALGVEVIRLPNRSRADAQAAVAFIGQLGRPHRFQAIHIFRLYMAPLLKEIWALPAAQQPRIILDADDYESKTQARLAEHARFLHQPAQFWLKHAQRAEKTEDRYIPRCRRVYVCTTVDQDELNRRFQMNHCLAMPNAVELPPPAEMNRDEQTFTCLFVGTLGYFPNEDAILFFGRQILPRLRSTATQPLRVIIVGGNPAPPVQAFTQDPQIIVTGFAPDLAAYYRQAHVAIAPIRVGGGMRIKVLEAFGYRCPVVSTTIGVEGIAVIPDKHLLIADTVELFTQHCLRLLQDPALGQILAHNAYELASAHYARPVVQERIRQDYHAILA